MEINVGNKLERIREVLRAEREREERVKRVVEELQDLERRKREEAAEEERIREEKEKHERILEDIGRASCLQQKYQDEQDRIEKEATASDQAIKIDRLRAALIAVIDAYSNSSGIDWAIKYAVEVLDSTR